MPQTEIHRRITSEGMEIRGDGIAAREPTLAPPEWIGGNISAYDTRFLTGLINFTRPRNLVEIGVASGWSSAVILNTLRHTHGADSFTLNAVDLFEDFYLNPKMKTGSAVNEVVPDLLPHYNLHTGQISPDAMETVGKVDFAFIDAHHYHPWTALDFLSVLPFMDKGRWVALHDINLCVFERHKHTNRGPYYLYHLWQDTKLQSTQNPSMIGALMIERQPEQYLRDLLEILHTPWELSLDQKDLDSFTRFVGDHFGDTWKRKFEHLFEMRNPAPQLASVAASSSKR